MGIRSTLASIVSAPVMALLEERLRELVDAQTETRGLAEPSTIRELNTHLAHARRALDELGDELETQKKAVAALQDAFDEQPLEVDDMGLRLAGLDARDEQLQFGVNQATDSVRNLADKVSALKRDLEHANRRLERAQDLTTQASTTAAESAAALEELRAKPPTPSVVEEPPAPEPSKPVATPTSTATPQKKATPKTKGCKVDGCDGKHRARGFCGRHYQMWSRGTLPGFVLGDGRVFFAEDGPVYRVTGKKLVGKAAEMRGDELVIDGAVVPHEVV
jgi:septal ring factor EnvC (AmiA/AmiB activator)